MSVTVINEQGSSRSLQIDALKMCPPIGAMYAAFGVHGCLPMSHGASGCCRFQRMELAKHFQRIVHVSSSLLREQAAIFGGEGNLAEAVQNAFTVYDPKIIAIHTTCLSETIGDDLASIIDGLDIPVGKRVVYTSTPGYAGSQLRGYSAMLSSFIQQLQNPDMTCTGELALLLGWVNPCDIQEMERYARGFFGRIVILPDQRGIMDRSPSRDEREYLAGGTPIEEIEGISNVGAIIALGEESAWPAAQMVLDIAKNRAMVPRCECAMLPIGIEATDRYLETLSALSKKPISQDFGWERQACIEKVMELHPRLYGKKVALLTDADITVPLVEFLASIGMRPVYIGVGWADTNFVERITVILERFGINGTVNPHADRYDFEKYLSSHHIDMLLGETRGKTLASRFSIPFVRIGFPIVDRPLAFLDSIIGYGGVLRLMREMLRVLAEKDEEGKSPEEISIAETF
jgi:nitrogenase molybdenum-iron protein beta chain